jgi:hypothetical protein
MALTTVLIMRRRLHQPGTWTGKRLGFADGTTAVVYRETALQRPPPNDPVVVVVEFRMWLLNGGRGQAYFRAISLLNTVLFAGFPGFATKLWMAADEHGAYRGLYEWDGVARAENYVRALWWPLALISHRDSIRCRMLPGRRRGDLIADGDPSVVDGAWWRPVTVESEAGGTVPGASIGSGSDSGS